MKLWLLRPQRSETGMYAKPWQPWYDKCFGFVVRAETEEAARHIAQESGGDETLDGNTPWLDASLSTCEELSASGEAGMIIEDVAMA